ncbi:HSP20-like chaperone, partial [Saitoella complicata NRRL Y-17804]
LSPALEIADKKTEVEIHAELPGIPKENINIHHDARSNTLTISGEHKQEQEKEEGTRRWSERRYGSFSRTISLPANVNAEQINASMENGMLKVILPKAPETEGVKKIAV